MASKVTALHQYGPRIQLKQRATIEEFQDYFTRFSPAFGCIATAFHLDKRTVLTRLLLQGRAAQTGIATYTPTISLDGRLNVRVRINPELLRELNRPGAFQGHVINARNIGRSSDDLVALWNEEHPTDPIPR
jgi:hypothetical protein